MLEAGWARINSLLGRGKEPLVDSTVHSSCLGGWNAGGRMGEDQQPPGQRQGASCRQADHPSLYYN